MSQQPSRRPDPRSEEPVCATISSACDVAPDAANQSGAYDHPPDHISATNSGSTRWSYVSVSTGPSTSRPVRHQQLAWPGKPRQLFPP